MAVIGTWWKVFISSDVFHASLRAYKKRTGGNFPSRYLSWSIRIYTRFELMIFLCLKRFLLPWRGLYPLQHHRSKYIVDSAWINAERLVKSRLIQVKCYKMDITRTNFAASSTVQYFWISRTEKLLSESFLIPDIQNINNTFANAYLGSLFQRWRWPKDKKLSSNENKKRTEVQTVFKRTNYRKESSNHPTCLSLSLRNYTKNSRTFLPTKLKIYRSGYHYTFDKTTKQQCHQTKTDSI